MEIFENATLYGTNLMYETLNWVKIPGTNWEVMQNGSDELFVRYNHRNGEKEIRLSPSRNGFRISDHNSSGKLKLVSGIEVE